MNHAARTTIFTRPLPLLAGLAGLLLVHAQVKADVPTPPPTAPHSAGFPSEQALINRGYDPKTGIWRVEETNIGKPTVKKEGGNITGTQGRNVAVTGVYGEKVNLNTSVSQAANVEKLQVKGAGVLYGGMAAGGAVGSNAAIRAYKDFKEGDYKGGFQNSIEAVLSGLSSLDITGLGSGLVNFGNGTGLTDLGPNNPFSAARAQAERDGNLGGAVAAAQAEKIAREAAAEAEAAEKMKQQQKEHYPVQIIIEEYGPEGSIYSNKIGYTHIKDLSGMSNLEGRKGKSGKFYAPNMEFAGNYFDYTLKDEKSVGARASWTTTYTPTTPEQLKKSLPLTESEIADILRRMLESNQTNHAELMRQLSMMGNIVPQATTNITYNQTTAKSAPYTPQGSGQAQQTQVTINPDGSITTNIIPRPDLKPDSSQAPTREQITPSAPSENQQQNPNGQQQNPNGQSQNQQQQDKDFCDKHPDSLMCSDMGNADYEDVAIPHQDIPLDFSPADLFATDGVCPEPRYVDLGAFGVHEFGYDGICGLARKLRPLFILSTILGCAYFIYASLDK